MKGCVLLAEISKCILKRVQLSYVAEKGESQAFK